MCPCPKRKPSPQSITQDACGGKDYWDQNSTNDEDNGDWDLSGELGDAAVEEHAEPEAMVEGAEADAAVEEHAEPEAMVEGAEADAAVEEYAEPEAAVEGAEADAAVEEYAEPEAMVEEGAEPEAAVEEAAEPEAAVKEGEPEAMAEEEAAEPETAVEEAEPRTAAAADAAVEEDPLPHDQLAVLVSLHLEQLSQADPAHQLTREITDRIAQTVPAAHIPHLLDEGVDRFRQRFNTAVEELAAAGDEAEADDEQPDDTGSDGPLVRLHCGECGDKLRYLETSMFNFHCSQCSPLQDYASKTGPRWECMSCKAKCCFDCKPKVNPNDLSRAAVLDVWERITPKNMRKALQEAWLTHLDTDPDPPPFRSFADFCLVLKASTRMAEKLGETFDVPAFSESGSDNDSDTD